MPFVSQKTVNFFINTLAWLCFVVLMCLIIFFSLWWALWFALGLFSGGGVACLVVLYYEP